MVMTLIMIVMIIIIMNNRFPAHDELGTCRTRLVSPKQSVLRITIGSTRPTVLTITQRNIIETRPEMVMLSTYLPKICDHTKIVLCL